MEGSLRILPPTGERPQRTPPLLRARGRREGARKGRVGELGQDAADGALPSFAARVASSGHASGVAAARWPDCGRSRGGLTGAETGGNRGGARDSYGREASWGERPQAPWLGLVGRRRKETGAASLVGPDHLARFTWGHFCSIIITDKNYTG